MEFSQYWSKIADFNKFQSNAVAPFWGSL